MGVGYEESNPCCSFGFLLTIIAVVSFAQSGRQLVLQDVIKGGPVFKKLWNSGVIANSYIYLQSNDGSQHIPMVLNVPSSLQPGGTGNVPTKGYYLSFGHMQELFSLECTGALEATKHNTITIGYTVNSACPATGSTYFRCYRCSISAS